MKLSKAIEELQKILEAEGDIELFKFYDGSYIEADCYFKADELTIIDLEHAWVRRTQGFSESEFTLSGEHAKALNNPKFAGGIESDELPKQLKGVVLE